MTHHPVSPRSARTPARAPTSRLPPALRCCLASFLVLLAACASHPGSEAGTSGNNPRVTQRLQKTREAQLRERWQGKAYEDLLSSYGRPELMMNVLGWRPLKTSLVVFGVVDQTSQCVDAFTMVKNDATGQWTVADYFCR